MKLLTLLILFLMVFRVVPTGSRESIKPEKGLQMAIAMANSEMKRFPDASTVDFDPAGRWNYTPGLIAFSAIELWKHTRDSRFYEYAKAYADKYIDQNGVIQGYKMLDYSTDMVNSGKFLFTLYAETGDPRYKTAIYTLRDQLKNHPRTSEGGFWHKLRYPNQMWLDGLYMEAPFCARFAGVFNEPEAFNDVINQFVVVNKHTFDPKTGLNYHGWDESKTQKWADPETGCSPNFWGRAMGWYAMALVDVLDFIPEDHPKRNEIIKILNQVAEGIARWQDKKSGLWFQVLDQGNREGNYLESSASAMFCYSLLKAARLGYIDKKYRKTALDAYQGIMSEFVEPAGEGYINLTKTCSVAGLGGDPYRSGSFEYYIGEPVRDNDPKGVGPFILASLEVALSKE